MKDRSLESVSVMEKRRVEHVDARCHEPIFYISPEEEVGFLPRPGKGISYARQLRPFSGCGRKTPAFTREERGKN